MKLTSEYIVTSRDRSSHEVDLRIHCDVTRGNGGHDFFWKAGFLEEQNEIRQNTPGFLNF